LALIRVLPAAHGDTAPITKKQLVKACLSGGLVTCFVAESGKKIIGFIASYDWIDLAYGSRACYITQLYTHEKFRRCGVGLALMRYAAKQAIKRGCFKMLTSANKSNKSANAFYKNSGLCLRNNKSNRFIIMGESLHRFAQD
jgi:ribosomal protein S18 acetylase RimI-like enzyme